MNRRTLVSFVDALFLMLLVFVLIPHQPDAKDDRQPPGTIAVEIRWPDDLNTDVDLWLSDPVDKVPVGYSHRAGVIWNLLRDDLGQVRDYDRLNYENAFTRGAPVGEYQVNVHLYSNIGGKFPVPVEIRITGHFISGMVLILTKVVNLDRVGQQITVARFLVDENGFVQNSMYDIPRDLR